MSALWSFTGAPAPDLVQRMGTVLAHRAQGAPPRVAVAGGVTVAVAAPSPQLGGLVELTDRSGAPVVVGFAGRLPVATAFDQWAAEIAACAASALPALAALPGEWIVAVADARRLVVARDASGVRTAYWGAHDGRVFVAIEPKGVRAVPGFPRRLHPPALAQYLAFSFVPGERTACADLYEIPAGHALVVELATGSTSVERWFCHEEIDACDGAPEPWVARTRATVDAAVAGRLPVGEPVAAFLSGGLDSSLVTASAAMARRERGEDPPATWSLHFGDPYPNELRFAEAVATRLGTEHHVVEVTGRDVRDELEQLVWHLDEPIGDPVTAGNYALAAAIGRDAAWVLNGEGGDPVFGEPKNLPMLLAHWYPTGPVPRFREASYLATWRRAGEEIERLLQPDVYAEIDLERDLDGVVRPYFAATQPKHFLNKLMIANMRLKGAHLILPKVDRMLGAHGLVPLSPLFDPEVVRLSLEMPPTAKLRHGVEKWVLKEAYADLLPAEVLHRPKSGMRIPVRWWFRRDLRRVARDVLSPRAVRRAGVFRPERVGEMLDYRTGRDGLRLWMLVTFELWRRNALEATRPS